ncbi:uncharacterized protein LY89DRAFT_725271 [Mollisia scopiformis]|uniref:Uncharacterized protein n=1 Tax=Mollisia scopiformis TaxID=149040 RepID=A0A132B691_MOLSC|nr:uncharacterized protein LY89DRAFT_725271 [Mollisia scopiformis]KUJ07925.1 hypothetical protein LY89DRAFT_725271 [Mollisia scopiformis]
MAATAIVPVLSEAQFNIEASTVAPDITGPSVHVSLPLEDTHDDSQNFLVVSPYEEVPHLLDLRTLDTNNQLLARALVGLKCLRDDYATARYVDIFNWAEVVEDVRQLATASKRNFKEASYFIVVFRSRIPPETKYEDLGVLDKAAHAEATKSGGFLKSGLPILVLYSTDMDRYWFGSPDGEGRNLATCVWRSQEDARVGSIGEAHKRAAGATRMLYTEWRIERLKLKIKDGATAWEMTEW